MNTLWDLRRSRWLELLARCPEATFFHTPMWLDVVSRSFGGRSLAILFHDEDGTWALLPLSEKRFAKGLLPHGYSGETGVYGGLVSPKPLRPEQVEAMYQQLLTRYPNAQLFGNPWNAHAIPSGPDWDLQAHETHLLQLDDPELIRKRFSRGCKSRCNKARRAGLDVTVGTGAGLADLVYPLYLDSVRRWGEKLTWLRPKRYFEALLGAGTPHVTLLTAAVDNQTIAAMICTQWGPYAHYLAGFSTTEAQEVCAANLLMETAALHFHSEGCRVLDLGSSNGLDGVAQFKESFGAVRASYPEARRLDMRGRLYFAMRSPYAKLKERIRQ